MRRGRAAVHCPLDRLVVWHPHPFRKRNDMKKSKAKRCWICGNKLVPGRGIRRVIDGHERDLHKLCSELDEKNENRSNKAFGLEY